MRALVSSAIAPTKAGVRHTWSQSVEPIQCVSGGVVASELRPLIALPSEPTTSVWHTPYASGWYQVDEMDWTSGTNAAVDSVNSVNLRPAVRHGFHHQRRRPIYTGSLVVAWSIVLGCSSGDDDKKVTAVDWTAGRGSDACRQWQEAFCTSLTECGLTELSQCASQVQTVTCASNQTAADCAAAIEASGCSGVPTGCGSTDIADRGWAREACTDYLTAICTHDAGCGSTVAVADCVANMQDDSNCEQAIGVKLNYEDCLARINSAACSATMPTECRSLIYVAS